MGILIFDCETELTIPNVNNMKLLVKEGDYLIGGKTPIFKIIFNK